MNASSQRGFFKDERCSGGGKVGQMRFVISDIHVLNKTYAILCSVGEQIVSLKMHGL